MEKSIVENLKMLWRYMQSNRKGVNSVPSTLTYEGTSAESYVLVRICSIFANYFQPTFISLSSNDYNDNELSSSNPEKDITILPIHYYY